MIAMAIGIPMGIVLLVLVCFTFFKCKRHFAKKRKQRRIIRPENYRSGVSSTSKTHATPIGYKVQPTDVSTVSQTSTVTMTATDNTMVTDRADLEKQLKGQTSNRLTINSQGAKKARS